jgi:glucosamine--fructose-6-phosphate aminotransferase (isomerizing)
LNANKSEHQLLKEIREQPAAILETLAQESKEIDRVSEKFPRSVCFLGMGSSYYASLYAKYLLQEVAHIDVRLELASEFLHYPPHVRRDQAFVAVSQSGESVETVRAVRFLREKHASVIGVTNRADSKLAALSQKILLTHAGEEKASATKTFTSTLALMHRLAFSAGVHSGYVNRGKFTRSSKRMLECAQSMRKQIPKWEPRIKRLVDRFANDRTVTVLGRGYNLAAALQGAILLKEVAKLPAEGMSAGEFMHGPIEIASQGMLAVVLLGGHTSRLMRSLVRKLGGYGTDVLTIGPERVGSTEAICLEERDQTLIPISAIVCLDLLAYFLALKRRLNPDEFRHISKVTLTE